MHKSTFMFIFAAEKKMPMKKNLLIELLETGEKVSLYSPRFEGEQYTEFEKFLLTYKDSHPLDVQILIRRIDIIKQNGAEDRYFRYEGSMRDRVMALPSHLDTSNLRLYCLNISHKVLILGNGGIKTTQTYQEEEHLHKAVQTLQKIDIEIKQQQNRRIVTVQGTNLNGPLIFAINEVLEEE